MRITHFEINNNELEISMHMNSPDLLRRYGLNYLHRINSNIETEIKMALRSINRKWERSDVEEVSAKYKSQSVNYILNDVVLDGETWFATCDAFTNIQESNAFGLGETPMKAINDFYRKVDLGAN